MNYQIYNLEPGKCTCLLGDPHAGTLPVSVRMLSAGGALLDPCNCLRKEQFVYATVKVVEGPSLALSGVVVSLDGSGPLVQWMYTTDGEAEKVDAVLRNHLKPVSESEVPRRPVPSSSNSGSRASGAAASGHGARPSTPAPARVASPRPVSTAKSAATARKAAAARPVPKSPPASNPGEASGGVVVSGNKVDVDATLRRRARTVRSADIASRLQTVQVLDSRTIKQLIKDAVEEAVVLLGPTLGATERKRLLEEAEESFREKMRIFESEKAGLEEKTRLLQEELGKAQTVLAEERDRIVSADRFTLSDDGMVQLEQRLVRVLDRAIKKGHAGEQVEEELRAIVVKLLDDEREKIREKAQKAQSDKISLLEKKVQRLAGSLDVVEKERDHARKRADVLEAAGGVPLRNVMEAGIGEDDPERERKLALLKEIFEFNKEIRRELESCGRLPAASKERPSAESGTAAQDASPSQPDNIGDEAQDDSPERLEESEEAAIATSLGIKVTRGKDATRSEPNNDGGHSGTATEVIRMKKLQNSLQSGTSPGESPVETSEAETGADANPDDMPWQLPESMETDITRWRKVRSLSG